MKDAARRSNSAAGRGFAFALAAIAVTLVAPALQGGPAAAAPDAGAEDVFDGPPYEIRIRAREDWARITIEAQDLKRSISFDLDAVRRVGEEIRIDDLTIGPDGLVVSGRRLSLEGLRIDDLYEDDNVMHVVLRRAVRSEAGVRILAERDRVAVGRTIRVEREDFVRGDVICFGGNIAVAGEVNHDVLALFGNVYVEDEGIVQGDVAAIDGRVRLRGDGRVRGRILTPHESRDGRRRMRWRFDEDWSDHFLSEDIHYNRVDGLHLGAVIRAADPDSLLPQVYAGGGYAFVAKRGRYQIGLRQRVGEDWGFALGGSFYRRTATDDDWLSPKDEASAMALLVAEDFRDYYEEEGGRGHLTLYPGPAGELGASYAYLELDWMNHHPKLWSVFGWDKELRANFSSVPAPERHAVRDALPGTKLGEFTAWYQYDGRDDEIDPWRGWWGRIEYRKAGEDFKGDYDYERFTAELRRFQPLHRKIGLNARLKYGASEGTLPLMRAFYLGGLRTIRGIDHKSLRGEQMILGNVEYVVDTGLLDTRTAVFFDVGKVVGRDDDIFDDGEFSSAIGLRLILDEDLHVELAKSLDDTDESIRLWAMFARTF